MRPLLFAITLSASILPTSDGESKSNRLFSETADFPSTNEIYEYFKKNKVPTILVETQTTEGRYCISIAYPYSGIQLVHLYVFIKVDERWAQFMTVDLWETAPSSIKVKPNGKHVEIFGEDDELIVKVRSPYIRSKTNPQPKPKLFTVPNLESPTK